MKRSRHMPIEQRIEAATERGPGCHLWRGFVQRGHGRIRYQGKQARVARVVWILAHGELPRWRRIIHTCGNTLCVNVQHLVLAPRR